MAALMLSCCGSMPVTLAPILASACNFVDLNDDSYSNMYTNNTDIDNDNGNDNDSNNNSAFQLMMS